MNSDHSGSPDPPWEPRSVLSKIAKSASHVIAGAIVAATLLVLPACGIPQLRKPLAGPPLPDAYNGIRSDDSAAQPGGEMIPPPSPRGAGSDENSAPQGGEALPPPLPPGAGSDENSARQGGAEGSDGRPAVNQAAGAENSARLQWNELFDDPLLLSLIDQALAGNQELRILAQDVQIAEYEIQARRGELLPFVTLGGHAGLDKTSRFTRQGAVEEALEAAPGQGFPDPLPDFLVAANVSWQIDIWRQLRNARDAAALRFLATRDGQNYVVTRLVAEIAENYYELMALDNQLATLDMTIAIQEQSLKVATLKFNAGEVTGLPVQRFQAAVRQNQSQRFLTRQQVVQVENRINFLLGRNPQPVDRAWALFLEMQPPPLSAGVPAQLLQNRYDIIQAERQVAAAGLDVRVARANFFPRLDIFSGIGLNAFRLNYLFQTPESLIYNAAGELVAPLINKAAIRAQYQSANAEQLKAVYNYQRTVLNAYIEVVNRMAKVQNLNQSIASRRQQVNSLVASVEIAGRLFAAGEEDYVDVLFAQRDLQEARMDLIETKQQQLAAVVNLYQALGGGGFPAGYNVLPDLSGRPH